ncbi:MAG: type VI secretion system protein TssA, partial [Planctomycetia bacterium]
MERRLRDGEGGRMASGPVLDLASLLEPIANAAAPVGDDPRESSSSSAPFYALKDARTKARGLERKLQSEDDGDGAGPPERPDWRSVLKFGREVLLKQAKDLEAAAYLVEALARLEGFAGVRDGFELLVGLVERYWDGLYPVPDEDGVATKVAPLSGLNGVDGDGTLVGPLAAIPITQGNEPGPYAFWHYTQAADVARLEPDKQAARIQRGAVSYDLFTRAASATSAEFFQTTLDDVTAAAAAFDRLTALLDEKCGPDAPPNSAIRATLASIADTLKTVGRAKLASLQPAADVPADPTDGAASTALAAPAAAGGGGPL